MAIPFVWFLFNLSYFHNNNQFWVYWILYEDSVMCIHLRVFIIYKYIYCTVGMYFNDEIHGLSLDMSV